MNRFNYFLVDTFSNELFKGNPTPVCVLEKPLSAETMHLLAREFCLPVTVFVTKSEEQKSYLIRYFTRTGEIPACGHGTLGAAYLLLHDSQSGDQVIFQPINGSKLIATKGGLLTYVEYPKLEKSYKTIPASLCQALAIDIDAIPSYFFCTQLETLFIELENAEKVKAITPDFEQLIQSTASIKEVVVMSKSADLTYDFILRSFCPWIGIEEDPVTGSIHAVLGHYWKERLQKDQLLAYQASERGGQIHIIPMESSVKIGGCCRIIIKGQLVAS